MGREPDEREAAFSELRKRLEAALAHKRLARTRRAARTGFARTTVQPAFPPGGVVPSAAAVAAPAGEPGLPVGQRDVAGSGDRPLAVDNRGNALVSFVRGAEGMPPGDAPLPAAVVALWRDGRVLMVFDRYRQTWELPGGRIEQGESPRQAAGRELLEESGQEPDGPLRLVGYARFVLAPDRRAEYLAVFAGHCSEVRGFRPNEETTAIAWWDLLDVLPGRVQPLDAHLAALAR
ncbi:NUDIX hydrolase [Streptomyces griseoluteus]|uniref:NUDIX hydrolase n=1 Tax=Streptomyces griseoluteus TaxID=29306 RepID=UPI0033C98942